MWETSEFEARKGAIAEFNAANRFRKRGIALIPTKFGISFTTKFLNQVGCSSQRALQGDASASDWQWHTFWASRLANLRVGFVGSVPYVKAHTAHSRACQLRPC